MFLLSVVVGGGGGSKGGCRYLSLSLCAPQSDPEFVQWKKELTEAFTEAQKLLRRAPKVIGKGRTGLLELSKPPLTHRNSNGL